MYCWRARISYGFRAGVNEKENGKRRRIFMKTVTKFCLKMVQNYLPDAFILAILLTFVVFCGGMFLMNKSALQMIEYWGRGYSSMFVFGMQMVLVLLTGYVLALTPLAKKILNKVTGIPKTPQQALGLTALVSIASCYINWGFGLVIGAVLAKEVGKKVKGLHFPLLVAAAYGGEIIRGPSSSIPLVSATPGNFMEKLGLPLTPVGDTLYSSWNLVMTAIIVIMLFIVYFNMKPPANEIVEYSEKEQEKPKNNEKDLSTHRSQFVRNRHLPKDWKILIGSTLCLVCSH
jgi:short-chain fatty acids transporter